MLRNSSSAISRISFEAPDDAERTVSNRSFVKDSAGRSPSAASDISEASDADEWEAWREEHPCALQHFDSLAAAAAGKLAAIFLDYDGTLTPIVSNPDAAYMPEHTRESVRRVAQLFPTAIVSGRGREKVEAFVQLGQLFYAGSHGMDIVGPRRGSGCTASSSSSLGTLAGCSGGNGGASCLASGAASPCSSCVFSAAADAAEAAVGAEDPLPAPAVVAGTAVGASAVGAADPLPGSLPAAAAVAGPADEDDEEELEARFTFQAAAQYAPLVDSIYAELREAVAQFKGASVEHNKFCVSVHFRNCEPEDYPGVLAVTERVAGGHPALHITRGRKVLEVRPRVDWHKGAALVHLLAAMGLDDPDRVFALYIGDDRTDEDAFRVLGERGLGAGILVSTRVKPTAARWTLREPTQVAAFLNRLVAWGQTDANGWHHERKCAGWHIAPGQRALPATAMVQQQLSGSLQQQLLAATFGMDGLYLSQQQKCDGGAAQGRASGGLTASGLLQRPPLPPKPRRAPSSGVEGVPRTTTTSPRQQQMPPVAAANGSVAPAACSKA